MPVGKLDISSLIKNVKKGTQALKTQVPFKQVVKDPGTFAGKGFHGSGPVDFCIEKAARQMNLLRMEYTDSKGNVTIRDVEPYEIKGDSLYAFCLTKNEIRNFKLNGISSTEVLNQTYFPRWDIKI